ncbi:hypothetical protein Q9R30_02635 [Arthrobacter sp. AB6]|uniref:sunset domain-containing protein n=1 Tax=Arthrobacter sp. AB6 TaxID=2962570 RepID=UPI002880F3F3|nr:hypothetical protein [Arthrobacter sp. AB6]MDT0194247.1 hypothetical protein [Arthrobacter sp. AB6]
MDFVFWIILIIVIIGVVWWLLNRNSASKSPGSSGAGGTRTDGALSGGSAAASAEAAGTTGLPGAAGFGRPAEPAAPTTAEEPADTAASAAAPPVSGQDERRRQDEDEWETKWSEASGTPAVAAGGTSHRGPQESPLQEGPAGTGAASAEASSPAPVSRPVHHPEYTEPHAPTLPGAETAAVEDMDDGGAGGRASTPAGAGTESGTADGTASAAAAGGQPGRGDAPTTPAAAVVPDSAPAAETADRTHSSAVTENGADHAQQSPAEAAPEPAGHLAADEPYGAGSAAAGADGSGPSGYTVKGDAGTMVYYEEGHPEYEQARAEVWFESAAHAEAAGFRVPRRRRLQ